MAQGPLDRTKGVFKVNPLLQQDLITNVSSGPSTRSFDFVLGGNTAVNNAFADLWGGPTALYLFPTTPQQMKIVSTSANDSLAGSGIQKIILHYLDNNYAMQSEILSLNGTTPVNTVATNILRVNGMHAIQTGTISVGSAGSISLTNIAGSTTYCFIPLGYSTARHPFYTVPAGKTGYISHWQASVGSSTGTHFTRISIAATSHAGVLWSNVFLTVDEVGLTGGNSSITFPIPIPIPATADVKMGAISDAANANAVVTGAIMGWVE